MPGFLTRAKARRHIRRSVRLACQVVTDPTFRLVASEVLDLSAGGMLVKSTFPVTLGENVVVSLQAPRSHQWFDTQGRVARVVRGLRETDECNAVAIEFVGLDNVTNAILEAKLERFPILRATRPPRVDYAASVAQVFSS